MAQEKAKEDGYVKLERGFGAFLLSQLVRE